MDAALKGIQHQEIPELLVGFDYADDAGVYQISEHLAIVQTVDFFAPIVDDPFVFGQIAAANALSDIYAMGATPITALSIVGFPENGPDPEVLASIIRGGLDKLNGCRVALLGGHSVRDEEIKFGYAVTGTIDPARILENRMARIGDRVILTKRLGTGLIATALRRDKAQAAHVDAAVKSMVQTNRRAAEIVSGFDVRSMTDISGFGLIGHAVEVASASHLTIEFDHNRLPLLEGALEYSAQGYRAGGLNNNRAFFGSHVTWASEVSEDRQSIFFDPQTSGGLLVFVSENDGAGLVAALEAGGVSACEIGFTRAAEATCIRVV